MPTSSSWGVEDQHVAGIGGLFAAAGLAGLEREVGPGARVAIGVFGTCHPRGGAVARATDHEHIADVRDLAAAWHVDVEDQVQRRGVRVTSKHDDVVAVARALLAEPEWIPNDVHEKWRRRVDPARASGPIGKAATPRIGAAILAASDNRK